jgi:hypothetical protein
LCCIHVQASYFKVFVFFSPFKAQAPNKVQGFCLIFLEARVRNEAQSFCFFFSFKAQVANKAQGFYFCFFESSSSKTSKLFTKLVSSLCSSIGIGVFCAFGCALLMVFLFTLTKLTIFFLWWCLHVDGNHGNVNYHFLVHWFCCYLQPWLSPSINVLHCFSHALLLVSSWPLVVFFYWCFHGLDLFIFVGACH